MLQQEGHVASSTCSEAEAGRRRRRPKSELQRAGGGVAGWPTCAHVLLPHLYSREHPKVLPRQVAQHIHVQLHGDGCGTRFGNMLAQPWACGVLLRGRDGPGGCSAVRGVCMRVDQGRWHGVITTWYAKDSASKTGWGVQATTPGAWRPHFPLRRKSAQWRQAKPPCMHALIGSAGLAEDG